MNTFPGIILGSRSPRRKELLERIGMSCRIVVPTIEEKHKTRELPKAYVLRNASEKADEVCHHVVAHDTRHGERCVVITADTVVVVDERILEKPENTKHAHAMLQSLSGRTHQVITGVCLSGMGYRESPKIRFSVVTDVIMKQLSEDDIETYIASGEPMDKAGAYAIQGRGCYMIKEIKGSYTNVVGLPMSEVVDHLTQEFGYRVGNQ